MRRGWDDAWAKGTEYRDTVVAKLIADRWRVITLDELPPRNGRGPSLAGDAQQILPDLQCTKMGHTLAVEVKWKAAPTLGRLSGELEHGIDRSSYDACREHEQMMPTFLLIGSGGAGERIARITNLRVRESAIRGTPVVYFPVSQMRDNWLATLNRHVQQRDWPRARVVTS